MLSNDYICYTEREMHYMMNQRARRLFDGIAAQYDLLAELYSFLQNARWRRYLISRLNVGPEDTVMDLCTGSAGVAKQIARTLGSRVIGVDLSVEMLHRGRIKIRKAGLEKRVALVLGRAESLAFTDASFDAVCFTYLLRYVEDPEVTLREIVRVLKPGGRLVSLEFGVPENGIVRSLWHAYTRGVLPVTATFISKGWREVGAFLGPSISRFYRSYTVEHIRDMWVNLGIPDVQLKRLSLGGAVVMWGTKVGGEVIPR